MKRCYSKKKKYKFAQLIIGADMVDKESFIKRANIKHNNRYDYSNIKYKNTTTKIGIICSKHGVFYQRPHSHMSGHGCYDCSKDDEKKTTEQFIAESISKHGMLYDYSETIYSSAKIHVDIICKIHGKFSQLPTGHSIGGYGCEKCGRDTLKIDITEVILVAKRIHNNKYSYNKICYINSATPVTITCRIHGDFDQLLNMHTRGHGCKKCYYESLMLSNEVFISKALAVHGDKYGYSECNYINNKTRVKIYCKKHLRYFKQRPRNHLSGSGCPVCNISVGELKVANYLDVLGIVYIREHKLPKSNFRFDFFLPDLNVLIEYDGKQHYVETGYLGGKDKLAKNKENDKLKNMLASSYNIPLIRIKYTEFNTLENYLLLNISKIYRYKVNGVYYKNFLDLCRGEELPGTTVSSDVKKFRVYQGCGLVIE